MTNILNAWAAIVLAVASLLVGGLPFLLISEYSPREAMEKCVRHHGVASITNKVYSPGSEDALVVCRDGTVQGIKR